MTTKYRKGEMSQKNKDRLYSDMQRFCKQIGILKKEVPRLIFDREEMIALVSKRSIMNINKRVLRSCAGMCATSVRSIYTLMISPHFNMVRY